MINLNWDVSLLTRKIRCSILVDYSDLKQMRLNKSKPIFKSEKLFESEIVRLLYDKNVEKLAQFYKSMVN